MMIVRVLDRGLRRAWRQRRLLLPLYAASLLGGLLVALPAWRIIADFAGRSLAAEGLRSSLEASFLLELLARRSAALATLQPLLLLTVVLSLFVGLFLSGGALVCLSGDGRPTPRQFWGGAATHFGRFLRLLCWSLLPLLGLAALTALPRLAQRLFWGKDPYESVTTWVGRITLLTALLCLLVQVTLLDYARLDIVERGERATRRALWRSTKRLVRHFPLLFGAALAISVGGLLVLAGHRLVAGWTMGPSVVAIVSLIVLQQLVIVMRLVFRLWRWSTAYEIRQGLASFPREEMPPTQVLLAPQAPSGNLELRPLPVDELRSATGRAATAPGGEANDPPPAAVLASEIASNDGDEQADAPAQEAASDPSLERPSDEPLTP